jgi:hypothetical protein
MSMATNSKDSKYHNRVSSRDYSQEDGVKYKD